MQFKGDPAAIQAAIVSFINTWPLYSPLVLDLDPPASRFVVDLPETILRDCTTCNGAPTWERRYPGSSTGSNTDAHVGVGVVTSYRCTHCKKSELRIWYGVESEYDDKAGIRQRTFTKYGQFPAQSVEPDREIAKALPPELLVLFKKGLTSLAHGYGLGSLAYFRRVVEDGTVHLIDLFATRAAELGDEEAAGQIRAAKDARHMEERLKAAADALPANLRPGGVNPLAVLWTHYSRGIHGLSDEECLAIAQQLDSATEYIFRNWKRQMEEAAAFRKTVQRWSNPKAPDDKASAGEE